MGVEWKVDAMGNLDLYLNGDFRGYISNPEWHKENFWWRSMNNISQPMVATAPTLDDAKLIVQTLVMLEG